jgi:hypothetical protein
MSAVDPILAPDPDAMRRQLEHVFHGDLDGAHDGLIELAWNDARTGSLSAAELFPTDRVDDLVERAANLNRTPGVNVYVGAALRKPNARQARRATDSDFYAASCIWADVDADVVAPAIATCKRRGVPPTMTVVTGRHPHLRAQMWWRLDVPVRDPAALRATCLAVAAALGGDHSVVNPGRVLRLGGSVAWPTKDGRVLERTEVHIPGDGRPREYFFEQLARAFASAPAPAPELAFAPTPDRAPPAQAQQAETPAPITPVSAPPRHDGPLAIGSLSVEACLARIRAGDHWHDNTVRVVGNWIARGWSDAEILGQAESLTLPGWTHDQTRRDLARMIEGGRRKWNIPNPVHEIDDAPPPPGIDLLQWTADRYAGEARPITWLCRGTIPLGIPALIAAMGGLGKSYLALDLALQVAAGVAGLEQPRKILGGRIAVEGTAVIVTAEDSFDAVHRRLNRIDPSERRLRHPKRMIVLPLPDAGGPRPLIATNGKALARTPFFDDLKRQLTQLPELRLVVIDPLQAFVLADVNADPAAAQFLWSAMAELATATGATILLTHHMRKDGMLRIADGDDARETIRGTTALVDGARLAYALWKLDDEAARPICNTLQIPFARGRIVRGAVVKANDEADHNAHTYTREDSGLLVQLEAEPDAGAEPEFTMAQAREVLREIQRRFDEGNPFSHSPRGEARYLGHYLMRQYGMSALAAKNLITDWMSNGVIGIAECNRKKNLMGLKVLQWL